MDLFKRFPWLRIAVVAVVVLVAVALTNQQTAAEKEMYVIVEGSSDAVVLESERRWARSLGSLRLDQRVTVLDESQLKDARRTLIRVRAEIDGKVVEGWVKRVVLSDQVASIDAAGSEAAGVAASGQAAKGLNKEIEGDLEKNDPRFAAALELVTALEHTRNLDLGGDAEDPDPSKIRSHYERFGRDGKLIR